MVDDLTAQSFNMAKTVSEIGIDLLKLLVKKLEEEYHNNKVQQSTDKDLNQNKEEAKTLGEWAANKDLDSIEVSDKEVADVFEEKLKEHGFKYERIGDEKIVVEAINRNVVNDVMLEAAKEVAKDHLEEEKMTADLTEDKLKEQGVSYKREDNVITVSENDKLTLDKVQKEAKTEVKNKRAEVKAEKKGGIKEKIKKYKQKAERKDKNRQREKTKQKIKSQNKAR